jgi:hypothetical protein
VRTLLAASRRVAVSCCVAPTTRLAEGGLTVTVLTGARVTVIDDMPVFISLVAVMVVPPAPTAVTNPFASTVAAAGLLELQVTRRPVSVLPFASFVTAVSCSLGVIPTTRLADEGLTVTVATGTELTVIVGVVALGADSLVAVIVAVPGLTAVTVTVAPLDVLTELDTLTESTAGLLETQFTVRPLSVVPPPSSGIPVSTCVPPTTIGVVGAEMVTVFTGASDTVTLDVPVFVSLVAVIVVAPDPTAVTKPLGSTVAAAGLLEIHVTARPVSTFPFKSFVTAVSCWLDDIPTTRLAVDGLTVTVATGTGVTVIATLEAFPPADALMIAEPGASAVSKPVELTDAIVSSLLDHVTTRFERTRPLAAVKVAVNWSDSPATRVTAPFTMSEPLIVIPATSSGVRIA